MRRDKLWINNVRGLRDIKEDLREMLRAQRTLALQELEIAADQVYVGAFELVPISPAGYKKTPGTLQDSIQVDVSRSPRYPGLIVTASAINQRTGYDYARIQEENEEYKHQEGRQAHYLEDPFREAVADFYRRMGW